MNITTKKMIAILSVAVLSIILFSSLNSSLSPERKKEQKVFDEFALNLNTVYQTIDFKSGDDAAEASSRDISLYPSFELHYNSTRAADDKNTSSSSIHFSLNWQDPQNVKKGLRILELLSLANIFSEQSSSSQNQILITTSTGYKFQSNFDNSNLSTNNSLALAIVMLKS